MTRTIFSSAPHVCESLTMTKTVFIFWEKVFVVFDYYFLFDLSKRVFYLAQHTSGIKNIEVLEHITVDYYMVQA